MTFRPQKLFRSPWSHLSVLLGGFTVAGSLLALHQTAALNWVLLYATVAYLSWVGTGGIVLAFVLVMLGTWIATLSTPIANEYLWADIPLTPAQVWAIALALSWVLAAILVLRVAYTVKILKSTGFSQLQTWLMTVLTVLLGLQLGNLVRLTLTLGQ